MYIMVALAVASAAMGAYGQYQAGKSSEAQAKYQEKVDINNAIVAGDQARDAANRGADEAAERRQDVRRMVATQRAKAQGVDVDTGSMGLIQDETTTLGTLDSLRIFNNAQREAYGYDIDRTNALASAEGNRLSGKNAMRAGKIGAATSLLSGASSVADKFKPKKTN